MVLLDVLQSENLNPVERKKYGLKGKIIKYMYLKGSCTNTDICQKFNISSPTSMGILSELISENVVEKQGRGESYGGRKPDLYGLKSNSLYVLSIDAERYVTRMGIFDNLNNCVTGIRTYPMEISKDFSALNNLYQMSLHLIEESGIAMSKLAGIGVCMAGLVSSKDGRNYTYFADDNDPSTNQSIKEFFEEKFNKPVFVENDVKSAALAEHRFGLARDKKDVVVISIEWGVGIGIIMDGKLRRGSHGFAGEFGHIPLIENGTLCHCGKIGCLETVASGSALSRLAAEGLKAGKSSLLSQLPDRNRIEPSEIVDAALKGDQFAISLLAETGAHLGKGISILIQILNPELIIIGGEIARAKHYLTVPVQQAINTYSMAQLSRSTQIELSTIGNDAKILGAVATVMENIFEQ
jgi:glucokinase-like ROK family protein